MSKPIALIVEDEPLLTIHALGSVDDAGFVVPATANADEAVAILDGREHTRVVIADLQMPGSLNGAGLANTVRDRCPPILIIVVSGHNKLPSGELPDDGAFLIEPDSEHQMHRALSRLG